MGIEKNKKIRMKMILNDVSGAEIARNLGVDRSAVSKTIKGKIKSYRLRKAIADAIGCKVTELWPDDINSEK